MYTGIAIEFETLNLLPDKEVYENEFIYDDENIDDEPNVESAYDSFGNMVSSISMPPAQELERDAFQYRINELEIAIPS